MTNIQIKKPKIAENRPRRTFRVQLHLYASTSCSLDHNYPQTLPKAWATSPNQINMINYSIRVSNRWFSIIFSVFQPRYAKLIQGNTSTLSCTSYL